jgi:hypothetical protein
MRAFLTRVRVTLAAPSDVKADAATGGFDKVAGLSLGHELPSGLARKGSSAAHVSYPEAGIQQDLAKTLDSRLRGNDKTVG